MILSITHRGTGLIQTGLMTGFAIFPFVTSLSYPAALAAVGEMGLLAAPLVFAAKFAIVWPVMFHLFNGFRHLVSINAPYPLAAVILQQHSLITKLEMSFHKLNICNDKSHSLFQSWDMGWGFQIVDLYKTGYAVSALSLITTLAICLL